jgi:hypothetical protein
VDDVQCASATLKSEKAKDSLVSELRCFLRYTPNHGSVEEKLVVIAVSGRLKQCASTRSSSCMSRLRTGEISAFLRRNPMVRLNRSFSVLAGISGRKNDM